MPLLAVFDRLFAAYGPQHWWPAATPFEVMVGAVLTQNTAWSNVEKAIANLKANDCLTAQAIVDTPHAQLAQWLTPAGYFNVKATRLQSYCQWYLDAGAHEALSVESTERLRAGLLSAKGVGPETADDILLYAFQRPVFVIDAYTRRLFSRLGLVGGHEPYEALRAWFEQSLPADAQLFNEYHALIVRHAKEACRKRPQCAACCLVASCEMGKGEAGGQ